MRYAEKVGLSEKESLVIILSVVFQIFDIIQYTEFFVYLYVSFASHLLVIFNFFFHYRSTAFVGILTEMVCLSLGGFDSNLSL